MRLVEAGLNEEERFLRFNLSDMGLGKLAQDDHWELLRLAQAGEVEQTVAKLELHLNRAVQAITRYLASKAADTRPKRQRKKSLA